MPLSSVVPEVRKPAPSVDLLCIPQSRFKRPGVWIHFDQMAGEKNSARTLIAKVLQQGTSGLPSRRRLAAELEELWGGGFQLGGRRVGDWHRITLGLRWTAAGLLPSDAGDLTQPVFDFGRKVLVDPQRGERGEIVPRGIFERERSELLREIEVLPEDRSAWADELFLQEMCGGEPCAFSPWGRKEDVEKAEADDLESARLGMIDSSLITVLAAGPVDFSALETSLLSWLGERKGSDLLRELPLVKSPGDLRESYREADVDQSRFRFGFRVPHPSSLVEKEAQSLAAAVLGGGSQGRLFRIIREERSLAYGIYASLQPFKGLLLVEAGIDGASFEEVRDEVLCQVKDLAENGPDEEELNRAKIGTLQRWEGVGDTAPGLAAYWGSEHLLGSMSSPEARALMMDKVDADAIARAAATWLPDTVFLLGSR